MKKALKISIGVIFLSWLLSAMVVRQYYTRNMAETPQPQLNRTVAVLVNYGKTVYVTPAENRLLFFTSEWVCIPIVIAFILVVRIKDEPKPKNDA